MFKRDGEGDDDLVAQAAPMTLRMPAECIEQLTGQIGELNQGGDRGGGGGGTGHTEAEGGVRPVVVWTRRLRGKPDLRKDFSAEGKANGQRTVEHRCRSGPRHCPADHGRSHKRIAAAVTVPWKT